MKEFYGVYRGFTPTDESALAIGEMELTIGEEELVARLATGLMIREERIPRTEFVPMTGEELSKEFKEGSSYATQMIGFRQKDGGIPKLLFMPNPSDEDFGLIVRMGEMSEILGPTLLFSPAQVAGGKWADFLKNVNLEYGDGVFPLLANEGKA